MCVPAISQAAMFWASLAVSTTTTAIEYIGQKRTADSQYQAQLNNNKALRDASISNMVQKGNDLNSRQQEETAATAVRINNQKLAASRASATAEASSESAGTSFDMLLSDYNQQYLNYADSQMQQLGFSVDQINRSRDSIAAEAESRINSGWDRRPINQPSLGLALLDVGVGALSAYDTYSTRDPVTGKYTLG